MATSKKRKAGRPALPKASYRGELITVRLKAGERQQFEKAAKSKNMTLSELIRRALKSMLGKKTGRELA